MPEMSLVANQTYALICRNSSLVSYDGFHRTMDRLKELKSRVVFIGDSIAKQQLMHLSCMIDPGMVFKKDEIQDWHEAMGNWRARETRPKGVHVKSHKVGPIFQNTQLCVFVCLSIFLCFLPSVVRYLSLNCYPRVYALGSNPNLTLT
jgi:hypothetical protein